MSGAEGGVARTGTGHSAQSGRVISGTSRPGSRLCYPPLSSSVGGERRRKRDLRFGPTPGGSPSACGRLTRAECVCASSQGSSAVPPAARLCLARHSSIASLELRASKGIKLDRPVIVMLIWTKVRDWFRGSRPFLVYVIAIAFVVIVSWTCALVARMVPRNSHPQVLYQVERDFSVGIAATQSLVFDLYIWGVEPPWDSDVPPPWGDSRIVVDPKRVRPNWGPLGGALRGTVHGVPLHQVPRVQLPSVACQASYGVPFRALMMTWEVDPIVRKEVRSHMIRHRLLDNMIGKGLPIGVLWRGFVLNSALYWVLLTVAHLCWHVALGLRRVNRGLCPLCRYEMADRILTDGCPECGWNRRVQITS